MSKPDEKKTLQKNVTTDKKKASSDASVKKPAATTTPTKPKTPRKRITVIKDAAVSTPSDDGKENENLISAATDNNSQTLEPISLIAGGSASTKNEEDEIVASIIAPIVDESFATTTKLEDTQSTDQTIQPVASSSPVTSGKTTLPADGSKEQVNFIGGENPDNQKFADTLRKHMSTIVNYLTEYKKKFNVYKETVEKLLADSPTPGIKYTYDSAEGVLTGNYFEKVEIKMAFEVTAHASS